MADPFNVHGSRDTVGLSKGSPTELAEPYEPVQNRAAVDTDPEGESWRNLKDAESRRASPVTFATGLIPRRSPAHLHVCASREEPVGELYLPEGLARSHDLALIFCDALTLAAALVQLHTEPA